MKEFENLIESTNLLIEIRLGSYSKVLIPYSESVLLELAAGLVVSTDYDGRVIKTDSPLTLAIVNTSRYKAQLEDDKAEASI